MRMVLKGSRNVGDRSSCNWHLFSNTTLSQGNKGGFVVKWMENSCRSTGILYPYPMDFTVLLHVRHGAIHRDFIGFSHVMPWTIHGL